MKAYLRKALLLLFGLFLPVALLEFAVRLLPAGTLPSQLRATGARTYYRPDAELRHVIKPHTDVKLEHVDFSFRLTTRLNFPQAGFRGGLLGGQPWGIALGDSFTFGAGVNEEATWAARLAGLAKREVINLGVPGHGPSQYTKILERYGLGLGPKLVLYAVYTNDLEDSVRYEEWLRGKRRRPSLKRYLRQNSATYNLFRNLRLPKREKSRYIEVPGVHLTLLPRKLKDPYDLGTENYPLGLQLAARQIELAYQHSHRIGARFVLLYFPSKEEIYWDRVKETVARRFASFEQARDRLRSDLREFCLSRGLSCLDLSAALRARSSNGEELYFPVDIHWNENGHRLVAEEIHKFLAERKIR